MGCTYVATDTWERFLRVAASLCRWEIETPAAVLEHLLFGGETVEHPMLATFLDEIALGNAALERSGASGWLLLSGAAPRRAMALFDGEILWSSGAGLVRADPAGAKFFLGGSEVDVTTFRSHTGLVVRKTTTTAVFAPTLGVLRAAVVHAQENGAPLRFVHAATAR